MKQESKECPDHAFYHHASQILLTVSNFIQTFFISLTEQTEQYSSVGWKKVSKLLNLAVTTFIRYFQ